MKKINFCLCVLLTFLFSTSIYAAENVIAWNLTPLINFPATTTIGNFYNLTYTIHNNHPVVAIGLKAPIVSKQGQLAVTNNCANVVLAPKGKPGNSCTISIVYQPQTAQHVQLQIELQYGFNRVRLPMLQTDTFFTDARGGRLIGYMPGYFTPQTAQQLSDAGYTHILIAFGVFSLTNPGQIVSAFSQVPASLIRDLKNAGIKVLLSLGGASTDIPGTTVNFQQAINAASSEAAFIAAFNASMESLVAQYGFEGFDIDVEEGLGPSNPDISNPGGAIQTMATIINNAHAAHPDWLLTMAPQCANIAATSSFNSVFANYSSLVMLTSPSLTWVGIQVYNAGTIFGIDQKIYDPKEVNNPDASVALAVDLFEPWPTSPSPPYTPFQPYMRQTNMPIPVLLNPSQVVVGYLAKNSSGQTDGSPFVPVDTIKRVLQCLRTRVAGPNSCGSYVPLQAYQGFGGVFVWNTFNDASTNFAFARALYPCVTKGTCT